MDTVPCVIFNFLGFISSAATAYIYEFVHRAENLEEKCIFHLAASLAVTEFVIFTNAAIAYDKYYFSQDATPILSICTFAFSSFLWSAILAFHVKKKFTPRLDETSKDSQSNDAELMKKYLLIGYGIPFLIFTCHAGGIRNRTKELIIQTTIALDVFIIILIGLIIFRLSTKLLCQLDNAEASLKSNDPLKLDTKEVKLRQRFTNTLFQILVLPWVILLAFIMIASPMATDHVQKSLPLVGATVVIGLQGILLFISQVLHREQIWKDLNSEYGLKKSPELKALDKIFGYVSEDDDEAATNNKTRWDLLAKIHYMSKKYNRTNEEAKQQPNPKVNSQKETQNMQPAIHQYVGGLPGAADNTDANMKLINEMV